MQNQPTARRSNYLVRVLLRGWTTLNVLRRSWVAQLFGFWFIKGYGV